MKKKLKIGDRFTIKQDDFIDDEEALFIYEFKDCIFTIIAIEEGKIKAISEELGQIITLNDERLIELTDTDINQNKQNDVTIVKQAFKELYKFCSKVELIGFIKSNDIPRNATKRTNLDFFSHCYKMLTMSYWDDCDFYGIILLPINPSEYMKFRVSA